MSKIRVAIADDEVLVLEGLKALVESLGEDYAVSCTAGNGMDMLRLLGENKTDLLLTDIRMPRMDGIQLTTELEKKPGAPCTIIVSAYDDRKYLQHAIRSPIVYDYVIKPFHRAEFIDLMHAARNYILDKRRQDKQESRRKTADSWDRIISCIQSGQADEGIAEFRAFWARESAGKTREECVHAAGEIMMQVSWRVNVGSDRQGSVLRLYNGVRTLEKWDEPDEIGRYVEDYIRAASCDTEKKNKVTALVTACLQLANEKIPDKYFGIAEAAAQLDVTPNYLSARFSRDMGLSFTKYLTMMRLEKAKEYLQTTTLRVYQISDLVGFEDSGYFDRVFKDNVGMRPSDFRNAASGGALPVSMDKRTNS